MANVVACAYVRVYVCVGGWGGVGGDELHEGYVPFVHALLSLKCLTLLVCAETQTCVSNPICTTVCAQVYLLAVCLGLFYFSQITNSNELPPAIIAHFNTDPARWGGQ